MKRFTTTITVPSSPDLVQSDTQMSGESISAAAARHAMNVAAMLESEMPADVSSWTVEVS